jgi:uncharacterized protein (DUF2141 family)
MKILVFILALSNIVLAGELKIIVKNITPETGMMRLALWDGANGFPKDHRTSIDQVSISVDNTVEYTFSNLDQGSYALAIFQDLNSDQDLNTNSFGIPKEPFGFSNNPRLIFGPPTFRKCRFNVPRTGTVTKTIYLKRL